MEQGQEKVLQALGMVEAKAGEELVEKVLVRKPVERKGIVKMNKIEEAIEKLPVGAVCFLLELGTGKMEVTEAIGKTLKEKRPFSVLLSIDEYTDIAILKDLRRGLKQVDLDDNVIMVNIPKEQFLNTNQTRFNIIFAHNSIDVVPYKKFLTNNGQVVIVSKMELK